MYSQIIGTLTETNIEFYRASIWGVDQIVVVVKEREGGQSEENLAQKEKEGSKRGEWRERRPVCIPACNFYCSICPLL